MKPRFDPRRHHRRSIRLPGYDYRQKGAYFVTVCTHERELLFEDPVVRRVVETVWQRIPRHFAHVQLDAWVVMPNHVHGIVIITEDPCRGEASPEATSAMQGVAPAGSYSGWEAVAGDASPLRSRAGGDSEWEGVAEDASSLRSRAGGVAAGSLGAIVGNYKSVTARRINRLRGTPGMPVWQRNYYEHIVRDERALNGIRQYIADNPAHWAWDRYNPAAVGPDPRAAELWRLLQ